MQDCPISRDIAYFYVGSYKTCHDCENTNYWNYVDNANSKLLCFGCLDHIDFSKIEKILHLEKEESHIRIVKLLMTDGSIIEKYSDISK